MGLSNYKSIKRYKDAANKQPSNFKNFFGDKRNTKPPAIAHQDIPPLELCTKYRDVLELKLDGWTTEDIHLYLQEHYKIGKSARIALINTISSQIKILATEHLEDLIVDHFYKYEDLYRKAVKIGNGKLQLKALDAKEKLLGVTNDTEFKVQINNLFNIEVESNNSISLNKLDQSSQNKLARFLNKIEEPKAIDITNLQK